jgi:hypothetical protein
MNRVEVASVVDEGLAEWEGKEGVKRGKDGGILGCVNWGRAWR